MANMRLGHTVIVANPASHSGRGAAAAERVERFFSSYSSVTSSFELRLTRGAGDGRSIAAASAGADTLIALGGDGVIHDVVNGLMELDRGERPRLGVIPMGSGNDFARTIGATFNRPEESLRELLGGRVTCLDLGHVESDAGESAHFIETLSFGMDAAIALDTTRRRSGGTRQEGEALFATSALRIVAAGARGQAATVSFDGSGPQPLQSFMFAVQVGPTYGGGFRICPDADPTDGRLDVCFNVRQAGVAHLLFLLGLARFGHHTASRVVELRQTESLELAFDDADPPCQVDGERLRGRRFSAHVEPRALDVIVPARCRW